jgi:two-component system, NarL family, nitrate/nitrite response regulator NarL
MRVENNPSKIRIAILDDHQGIIDGYLYRLSNAHDIDVVFTLSYGEALEAMLAQQPVDVLLLDVSVPTSPQNANPYPILHLIPRLLQTYPDLEILVISMYSQRALINSVMEAGASGFILKDDQQAIRELAVIIRLVAHGGIHLSQKAHQELMKRSTSNLGQPLSSRQTEALSLCAAYPEADTSYLARQMGVANSTIRNILSGAYLKLNVRNRAAAVAKARQMGLITPESPPLHFG